MSDEQEECKCPAVGLAVLGIEVRLLKYFKRTVV